MTKIYCQQGARQPGDIISESAGDFLGICSSSSIRARITAKSCQAPRGCRVELLRHRDEGGAPRIEDLCSAPIMTTPGSRQIVLQGRPTVSVWRTEYVNYVTPLPKMVSANRGQCSVIRRNRHHHHQPFRLRGIEESGSHLTRRWSKRDSNFGSRIRRQLIVRV